jgi:hypothetical protein
MKGTTAGTVVLQAVYGGDSSNTASSRSANLVVRPARTTLSILCTSYSIPLHSSTTCTATLTHNSTSVTGQTVTWFQTAGRGRVSFSPFACALSSAGSCSVTVTGTGRGHATFEAVYSGDQDNVGSARSAFLSVT